MRLESRHRSSMLAVLFVGALLLGVIFGLSAIGYDDPFLLQ